MILKQSKCLAMHYGVTKLLQVQVCERKCTVCKIATQHFPHKSHTNLIINHNLKSASVLVQDKACMSLLRVALPAQDVSIGRQRHVGTRHTCPL